MNFWDGVHGSEEELNPIYEQLPHWGLDMFFFIYQMKLQQSNTTTVAFIAGNDTKSVSP